MAARQRAAREVVGDVVGDGRPVGGVRPVARGAPGDGDGRLRRRGESRPRPSGEVVVVTRRIDQRDGALDVVGRGIATRQRAAVEGVADGVGEARPLRVDCRVPGEHPLPYDIGGAAAVGCGIPLDEGIAGAREAVRGDLLGRVPPGDDGGCRARTAVPVEADGVGGRVGGAVGDGVLPDGTRRHVADLYRAAGTRVARTDAVVRIIALGDRDGSAVNGDVAATGLISAFCADSWTVAGDDIESSRAVDEERIARRNVDAAFFAAGHRVHASENDMCVAETPDARYLPGLGVDGDRHVGERHRCAFGDAHVVVCTKRTREDHPVGSRELLPREFRDIEFRDIDRRARPVRRVVHVDVGGVAAALIVQVEAGRSAVLAHGAALRVVEPDGVDGALGRKGVLRVVEVDRGTPGVAVQVALLSLEMRAAVVRREVVGLASV